MFKNIFQEKNTTLTLFYICTENGRTLLIDNMKIRLEKNKEERRKRTRRQGNERKEKRKEGNGREWDKERRRKVKR